MLIELSHSEVKLLSLIILSLIVENVSKAEDDSKIVFVLSQAIAVPSLSLFVIFQLAEAVA